MGVENEPGFEVASGRVLREKYGLSAANRPTIRLRRECVPENFQRWIPLAERWGISDDLIREDGVLKASAKEIRELLSFGEAYDAVLSEWLIGQRIRRIRALNTWHLLAWGWRGITRMRAHGRLLDRERRSRRPNEKRQRVC